MIRQERLIGCPGFNWDILGLGSIHCTGSFISWHPVRQDGLGLTHTHAQARTHTTRTHTHARTYTHAHTRTHTHTHARTRAHTHARTHALHTRTRTHTHTLLHLPSSFFYLSSSILKHPMRFLHPSLSFLHLFFIHAQPFIQCVFSSPQVNHATHIRTVTTPPLPRIVPSTAALSRDMSSPWQRGPQSPMAWGILPCRIGRVGQVSRLHPVPFSSLSSWETGASEMRDRARDWSERGRPSSPFSARLCLSLAPVSQVLWTRKKKRDCVQSTKSATLRWKPFRREAKRSTKYFRRNSDEYRG